MNIKLCKIHKCLPRLRTISPADTSYLSIKYTRQEYYCAKCEEDKKNRNLQDLIDQWNKRQEEEE